MLKNSLAVSFPEIAKQWHPTKNGSLIPHDVTYGSSRKVWWKCSQNENHEWQASINSRVHSKGNCPICFGKKVGISNSFGLLYKEIAKEWHPVKNKKINPFQVTSRSNKRIWWKCSQNEDHEWKVSINSRVSFRSKCPFCKGKKVSILNSLAATCPSIIKLWHPTKNGSLTPHDVTYGSSRKVWWKCPQNEDHEWQAAVYSVRNTFVHQTRNGIGCPFCRGLKVCNSNSLATIHPKIAKQWHPKKNLLLTPKNTAPYSNKKIWWVCDEGHEWLAIVRNRTQGTNCPYCSRNKKLSKS